MRRALASFVATLVVGCSTAPVDTAERSLCSLAVFSFETLKGTANGAATGFVAAARSGNCSDPKVCCRLSLKKWGRTPIG